MVIYSYERDEIALRNNRRTDDDPQLVFVVPFRLIEGGIDPFDGYSTVVVDSMSEADGQINRLSASAIVSFLTVWGLT
jgi:hypothetical protein